MKKYKLYNTPGLLMTVIVVAAMMLITACGTEGDKTKTGVAGAPYGEESLNDIVKRRGLNADDVLAATKTYTPDNLKDE